VVSRFVRRVRTASGAVAVQVVVKEHGEVVEVDHVGSAHTDAELALLLAAAADRLHPGQESLDLGPLPQPEVRLADVADWTDTRRDQIGADSAVDVVATGNGVEVSGNRPVHSGGRVVRTSALTLWSVLEQWRSETSAVDPGSAVGDGSVVAVSADWPVRVVGPISWRALDARTRRGFDHSFPPPARSGR
jgi:hypothetical protein